MRAKMIMIKCIVLAGAAFSLCIGAVADDSSANDEQILYRPPEMGETEFEAQKIVRTEKISYDEYMVKQIVPSDLRENLAKAFQHAQEEFLRSEISQIQSQWEDVVSFAFKADWGPVQREMIQTAYLRLAQIAKTSETTRELLQTAIDFDAHYIPEKKLFPPPLVAQYLSLRAKKPIVFISQRNFMGFTILLINGVRHNIQGNSPIETTGGTKRITFLSPSYKTVTRVLDAMSIEGFQPQKAPLKNFAQKPMQINASQLVNPSSQFLDQSPLSIAPNMATTNSVSFYQKSNFWVGTALVVAVAIVMRQNNQDKPDKSTTHREGF